MKQKFIYTGTAILSLLLCFIMLFSTVPHVKAEGDVPADLNYGITDSEGNTTVSAVELYEQLFASSPTKAEKKHLSLNGITLTYNNKIPSNLITTDYNGDEGVLTTTIRPYIYTAANGETVTWIPAEAWLSISDEPCKIEKEGEVYVCRLNDLYISKDFDIKVKYRWEVTIPASAIEHLRNSAYEAGAAGIAIREEYQKMLRAWEAEVAAYEEWNEYLAWKVLEDAYLEKLVAYNVLKQAYDAYCKKYSAYEDALALYNRWQAYFAYEEYSKLHLDAYNQYDAYRKQYKAVTKKLSLMESMFVNDSNQWQMYGAITGGTVNFVLENEDLLVNTLGYKEEFIKMAADATIALRELLPKYDTLRRTTHKSEFEHTKALYAFYTENYDALKKNFCDLYAMLKDLFEDDAVKRKLLTEGKLDHYLQFVGQLYVISTCLDEEGDRNPNWTIAEKKLSEVVEACHLLPDGDWHPANTLMPSEEVAPVEFMEPVTRPEGEKPTSQPTPPMPTVKNPGPAPTPPEDPWNGNYPSKTEHPGKAPTAPVFDALTSSLMSEIDSGKLSLYTGSIEAQTLQFEGEITRSASFRNYKTVSFYDHEHNLLESFQVEYGTSVSYKVPDRDPTVQYSFSEGRWTTLDGDSFNLSYITKDLALYPTYKRTLQSYLVTWIFGDMTYEKNWQYGDIPSPPSAWSLETYEKDHYRYTFSGWDQEVVPVAGETVYRGEMIPTIMEYEVTWVLYGDKKVTQAYPALTVPTYEGDLTRPADNCRYTFDKWINHGTELTGNTVYYASWSTVKLAGGGLGNTELNIEHKAEEIHVDTQAHPLVNIAEVIQLALETEKDLTLSWENGIQTTLTSEQLAEFRELNCTRIALQEKQEGRYTVYRLGFADKNGNPVQKFKNGVTVTLPISYGEEEQTVFFIVNGENYEKLTEQTVLLTEESVICSAMSYLLTVTPDDRCNTMNLPPFVTEGDTVSLKLNCIFGYEITGASVQDADGNSIPVSEDLTFIMPASPVTVTLDVNAIRYTVIFMVDGKVWDKKEYALGEEIALPKDPEKAPEDDYSFTFVGWGEVPSLAAGDVREMTFTASFSRAKQNVDYTTGLGGSVLFDVILPIAFAALVLLIIGLIAWIVIRKHKRRKLSRTESDDTPTDVDTDVETEKESEEKEEEPAKEEPGLEESNSDTES